MLQVIIIGGGLAGLLNAIVLGRAGLDVLLIEQKQYPFHKVCGEYVSHEVTPFLRSMGLYPGHLSPVHIDTLLMSNQQGNANTLKLPLGGFGISRYQLDNFWYQQAVECGVKFKLGAKVTAVRFLGKTMEVKLAPGEEFRAPIVIGAFGKRSLVDKQMGRAFMNQRSPYVGVKYHIKCPWESNVIALHNFRHGYCGISGIEDGKVNLCYLTLRDSLKESGDIAALEKNILSRNPRLEPILCGAERLFEMPMVISEVSFAPKNAVEKHVLMAGDSAGLIAPLCGNGMAMAIRSAHLLSGEVLKFFRQRLYTREHLENSYRTLWKANFRYRLMIGRMLQEAFRFKPSMDLLIYLAGWPVFARWIVKQTHGPVFHD